MYDNTVEHCVSWIILIRYYLSSVCYKQFLKKPHKQIKIKSVCSFKQRKKLNDYIVTRVQASIDFKTNEKRTGLTVPEKAICELCTNSDSEIMYLGVPQGSVLGPLLVI